VVTLFEPITFREVTVPNRAWMSPMCMYSARDGRPDDFHIGHYGARAAGGAGLVMLEATGVLAEGRISPWDLGLWEDGQIPAFARVVAAIKAGGAVPAVQLAHAGRKASVERPWKRGVPLGPGDGGWQSVGPSEVAFPGYPAPVALDAAGIARIVEAFAQAARRALAAGFEVAEIHAAHGYLLHEFLSPLSNTRADGYGGSLENRARLLLEVVDAVRAVWPEDKPVFLRLSSTDWVAENPDDGRAAWTVEDSVRVAAWARDHGVDLVDCSSGGLIPAKVPADRGYQADRAARIRKEADVPAAAVGRIDDPEWAAELVASGQVDAVFLGRALLADPSWANHAAVTLGAAPRHIKQYAHAIAPPR
jgi:2,4-dienoyl-CoA reductase-like NADH-dependent reductase (Old Yellow Enzyme family)